MILPDVKRNRSMYCQTDLDSVVFLDKKGLLCNLGSLSQELRLFQFDQPKTDCVRAKTCLTGQRDRRLSISYLQLSTMNIN